MSAGLQWALDRALVMAHQGHDFSTSNSDHHAAATGGVLETVIVVVGSLIVAAVVAFTLRYAFKPGEVAVDHIKRRVLIDDPEAPL